MDDDSRGKNSALNSAIIASLVGTEGNSIEQENKQKVEGVDGRSFGGNGAVGRELFCLTFRSMTPRWVYFIDCLRRRSLMCHLSPFSLHLRQPKESVLFIL